VTAAAVSFVEDLRHRESPDVMHVTGPPSR
jgi:hypothetical protein